MSWKASARHGVREAPAGLALLQELINTRATMSYGADLLANADDAQIWLTEALATWSRVSGLPAPTGRVYKHEIPGGQLSNLRQQAIALGLGDHFEKIEDWYAAANRILDLAARDLVSAKKLKNN